MTATVRITEAEPARDIQAGLAKAQEGAEVIVEQDHRPVAVIKMPRGQAAESASASPWKAARRATRVRAEA